MQAAAKDKYANHGQGKGLHDELLRQESEAQIENSNAHEQ
jgi:hypothetical protein